MGRISAERALRDASIPYTAVEQAFVAAAGIHFALRGRHAALTATLRPQMCRILLRRLDVRAANRVSAGHDRNPRLQRGCRPDPLSPGPPQLTRSPGPAPQVNNNCATGSTALFMARQFVEGGLSDCVLALGALPRPSRDASASTHWMWAGFEKMERGSLGVKYDDRTNPMDKHMEAMFELREPAAAPGTAQMFGNAGREHMERYGACQSGAAVSA